MSELGKLLLQEWFRPAHLAAVLYHYTTAAGLIGILQSNSIRGTSAAFQNDISEISHGVSICKGVIETMASEEGAEREFFDRVRRIFDFESAPTEVFITSFTTLDDALGQWRGYGSDAGRYSLGFRLSHFSERDITRFPRQVDYDPESQKTRVRKAIELTRDHLMRDGDRGAVLQSIGILELYLRRLVCIFKHPGFRDEQEWRSVSSFNELDSVQHVCFEVVDGAPRPHMTMLEGSRESSHLPLVEVRIGSVKREEAAAFATSLLLRRLGYHDATVKHTRIPFAP